MHGASQVKRKRFQRSEFPFRAKSRDDRRSHGTRKIGHGPVFRPGDPIRESGIYEVVHDNGHRATHEVVLISQDGFPSCDTCLDRVRFRLVRTAPYIFQDADFEDAE